MYPHLPGTARANYYLAEPTLAYTHLQAAQLITVGKRAAQWAQDLMLDLHSIEQVRNELKFRGAQGTTGTQASFLEIFQGDSAKCDKLNDLLCEKFGFPSCYDVSTQTYTRKVDLIIANAVTGLGSSAQKITGDIRHLAHWKEIEEPFESSQIGSSAMVSISHSPNAARQRPHYALHNFTTSLYVVYLASGSVAIIKTTRGLQCGPLIVECYGRKH